MKFTRLVILGFLLGASVPTLCASTDGNSSSSARIASLKEQLESGLRARRPQEFAFIGRVVKMVEKNELPKELVKSTFQWARRKKPYPYPFFERALKFRAARRGITVK